MKKVRLMVLLPIFILVIITGCTYKGYSGNHSDLYTVAINSVLWNNGHSFSSDRYTNSQIDIIDEDVYGRTIFTYYEKYYAGANISFSALIVCQNSNGKDVFYYEDINYIVKEQELYTQNIKEFEVEKIEQLKAINDWNQKINLDKCISKEIVKCKPAVPYEKEIKNKIINEFNLISGNYSCLFIDFLTSNTFDSNFIIYGYIMINDGDGIYFIGLVEQDKEINKINFLVPSNVMDYKTEFIEFKKINNWSCFS